MENAIEIPALDETEVLRVPLTGAGIDQVVDITSVFEGGWEQGDYEAMVVGKTFIRATRRLLQGAIDVLTDKVEDYADLAATSTGCVTDEQIKFAERSARRSVMTTLKRLQYAVDGKKQPKKIHFTFAEKRQIKGDR